MLQHSLTALARPSILVVAFPLIPLLIFAFPFKWFVEPEARSVPEYLYGLAIAGLLAAALWRLRYDFLTPACRITLRSLVVLFALFFAAYGPGAVPFSDDVQGFETLHMWLRPLALVVGVLSLFRPSFALVLFCLIAWQNGIVRQYRIIGTSTTDITVVFEFGITLLIGAITLYLLTSLIERHFKNHSPKITSEIMDFLLLSLVAFHFANYFFSGMAKVLLDGGWLSWLTENQTSSLLLAAMRTGHYPLILPDDWQTAILQVLHTPQSNLVINAVILGTQLLAPIALLRLRWTISFSIIYDIQHAGIFLLSGVFFYKWVWLNTTLAICLPHTRESLISWHRGIILIGYLLLSNFLFSITWLGWYETASLTHSHILAETADGQTHRAPTNYFLGGSIRFAQGEFADLAAPGFSTRTFGTTSSYDEMMRGNACTLPIRTPHQSSHLKDLMSFLKIHHKYILNKADNKGHIIYDIYPHHIWSNLFEFRDFYNLDKREIVRYRWLIKSECLGVGASGLEAKLRGQHELIIELPRQ